MSEETKPARVDEARAAAMLDRAARLDAGRTREVDLEELREAALEAGISPSAFERALVELQSEGAVDAPATPPLPPARVDREPTEPGLSALIGGVIVRLNPWADDDPDRLPERT